MSDESKIRNVRNFWIEIEVDGHTSKVAVGPAAADGGFNMTIRQRSNNMVTTTAMLHGRAMQNGQLILEIAPFGRMQLYPGDNGIRITTDR